MATINDLRDPASLQAIATTDLSLSEDTLYNSLLTHAGRYFFWARMAARAEAERRSVEFKVKEELWPQARQCARESIKFKGGKVTEGSVDDEALLDGDYRAGRAELVQAEEFSAVLRAAEQAMRQRMEMLRSLNSRQRAELSAVNGV